jgi:hypothetical protein
MTANGLTLILRELELPVKTRGFFCVLHYRHQRRL